MVQPVNPSDHQKHINPQNLESMKKVATSKTKGNDGADTVKGDEVVLSPLAKDMQVVRKHLGDVSPERLEKLKDIADRISKGQYHVDSAKIAEKMIEDTEKE